MRTRDNALSLILSKSAARKPRSLHINYFDGCCAFACDSIYEKVSKKGRENSYSNKKESILHSPDISSLVHYNHVRAVMFSGTSACFNTFSSFSPRSFSQTTTLAARFNVVTVLLAMVVVAGRCHSQCGPIRTRSSRPSCPRSSRSAISVTSARWH